MSQAQNAPVRSSRPPAPPKGADGFRPVALPAVAAAVQSAVREVAAKKLTINDFPAARRQDAAFDF